MLNVGPDDIIAGVGHRDCPERVLDDIETIIESLPPCWWRTGHARGFDYVVEQTAREQSIVYLPWWGFNDTLPLRTPHVITNQAIAEKYPEASNAAEESVDAYHPTPERLRPGARLLMRRNYFQVMGVRSRPVKAVVCYCRLKGGEPTGGTGQAIRIAKASDIPVFNLYDTNWRRILAFLTEVDFWA